MLALKPGLRQGGVTVPISKSHAHRLLIANFLAGDFTALSEAPEDAQDIRATKRCLNALKDASATPVLDCGESGSTLRFLAPVAAALRKRPKFIRRGRLAERPFKEYRELKSGIHELPGDVSSQFVTGLLLALPLLPGDSEIRFNSPLESRGYVEMTLRVLSSAGIEVETQSNGYRVKGGQVYRPQPMSVEGDWSGAAFWLVMNALGSKVGVDNLDESSAQPDRAIAELVRALPPTVDISQYPDLFPALAVQAAFTERATRFVNIRRLRLKECDRVFAMHEALSRMGVATEVKENSFQVLRGIENFAGGEFVTFDDHRIAMAVAVAATRSTRSVIIDNAECADKSYPGFFEIFERLAAD